MTSHSRSWVKPTAVAVACAATGVLLFGCGGEPEPEPTARRLAAPAAPPAPLTPKVTPVEDLIARLSIDRRISLPEDKAPGNNPDRIAVLEFFDAFARGDADSLRTMLPLADQQELNALVESGVWEETIAGTSEIAIETGSGPYEEKCALAIFEINGGFQPQLWYYASSAEGYRFDAAPTPPGMIDKLYGDDWIALWHRILEEEIELANRPDEEFDLPGVGVDEESGGRGSSFSGSPPGSTPNRPGGPPGRRQPPTRRRPPGPGG